MKFQLAIVAVFISTMAFSAEVPLSVPSDAKAKFFILEKGSEGALRTIVTRREGSSGTTYSKRIYNCYAQAVKYLGTGSTLEEMNKSKPDPTMSPIVAGSIAYYVGVEACKD